MTSTLSYHQSASCLAVVVKLTMLHNRGAARTFWDAGRLRRQTASSYWLALCEACQPLTLLDAAHCCAVYRCITFSCKAQNSTPQSWVNCRDAWKAYCIKLLDIPLWWDDCQSRASETAEGLRITLSIMAGMHPMQANVANQTTAKFCLVVSLLACRHHDEHR